MARYLLDDGVDAARLSQLRSAGSFLILLVILGLTRRDLLRSSRGSCPASPCSACSASPRCTRPSSWPSTGSRSGRRSRSSTRAPLGLLVWLALFHGRRLPPSLWGAVALSLVGCFFVVRAYDASSLDTWGLVAAFGAMLTFGIYMVGSERQGRRHEPVTTLFWAFAFASLFWALVTPWWSFPFDGLASTRNALLAAAIVVGGTLVPFILMVASLRHIAAPRAAVVATLEPVLAAVFAWLIHDEALAAVQIAGGMAVLAAVAWVQSRRPDHEAEAAPESSLAARFSPR
jgi:hypothetical protein